MKLYRQFNIIFAVFILNDSRRNAGIIEAQIEQQTLAGFGAKQRMNMWRNASGPLLGMMEDVLWKGPDSFPKAQGSLLRAHSQSSLKHQAI